MDFNGDVNFCGIWNSSLSNSCRLCLLVVASPAGRSCLPVVRVTGNSGYQCTTVGTGNLASIVPVMVRYY